MEGKEVFISYSRKDTPIADRICAALDRAGISYFIDRRGIAGGMEFPIELAKAINSCKVFLFLASTNSYESKFTNSEITFAFNEKPKNSLLPYIIDNSTLPVEMRFIFSGINWRNMSEHPIDTILIDDLCHLLGREKKAPTSPQPTTESPEELYQKGVKYENEGNFAESVKCYRKAAEEDHTCAQFSLASCYFYAQGLEHNFTEAFKWFHKAAVKGNSNAQYWLGDCYLNGKGVDRNYTEPAKWYRKAAEQGNSNAQYSLGYCYIQGFGVEKNHAEAAKWYRKAAEQGNAYGQEGLGYCYLYGYGVEKDYVEAAKWFRKAATQGNYGAQLKLIEFYYNGVNVGGKMPNVKRLRIMAILGDASAQNSLGEHYCWVEMNYGEAIRWFQKAAEQGNSRAQHNLANRYYYGEGVEKNYAEATKWFRKAADQGEMRAQYMLGDCYMYDAYGIKQNYAEAFRWFKKAAMQGDTNAQYRLGEFYHNGIYIENYNEAIKWYTKAAERGNTDAQLQLARCYYYGKGVEKNYSEAVKWLRKAAENGIVIAQLLLSECLRDGLGVDVNNQEAQMWYRKLVECDTLEKKNHFWVLL